MAKSSEVEVEDGKLTIVLLSSSISISRILILILGVVMHVPFH